MAFSTVLATVMVLAAALAAVPASAWTIRCQVADGPQVNYLGALLDGDHPPAYSATTGLFYTVLGSNTLSARNLDCEEVWSLDLDDMTNVPKLMNDNLLIVPGGMFMYGVDAQVGTIVWKTDVPPSTQRRALTMFDGMAFFAGSYQITAINSTGDIQWETPLFTDCDSTQGLMSPSGPIIVCVSSMFSQAFAAEDGTMIWSEFFAQGQAVGTFMSKTATSGNVALVTTTYPTTVGAKTSTTAFTAIDSATGTAKWTKTVNNPSKFGNLFYDPIAIGQSFYVVFIDGRVVSFDIPTGKMKWNVTSLDEANAGSLYDLFGTLWHTQMGRGNTLDMVNYDLATGAMTSQRIQLDRQCCLMTMSLTVAGSVVIGVGGSVTEATIPGHIVVLAP